MSKVVRIEKRRYDGILKLIDAIRLDLSKGVFDPDAIDESLVNVKILLDGEGFLKEVTRTRYQEYKTAKAKMYNETDPSLRHEYQVESDRLFHRYLEAKSMREDSSHEIFKLLNTLGI